MPGAVRILTAADIPSAGKNSFTNWKGLKPEEVHVGGTCVSNIHCCIGAGTRCITVCNRQAVALVLADTQQNANRIAQAVTSQLPVSGKTYHSQFLTPLQTNRIL